MIDTDRIPLWIIAAIIVAVYIGASILAPGGEWYGR